MIGNQDHAEVCSSTGELVELQPGARIYKDRGLHVRTGPSGMEKSGFFHTDLRRRSLPRGDHGVKLPEQRS